MRLKTYVEDPMHRMERSFLSADIYGQVVAAMVIVCVDALIVDRGERKAYLAKRRHRPMRGWWDIGGRVFPGEDFAEAMVRKFAQETGLTLMREKFRPLGFRRYHWKDREQEPHHLGCDNLVLHHVVELSPGERRVAAAGLDASEYASDAGLVGFDRAMLAAENVHPAIVDLYDEIFPG